MVGSKTIRGLEVVEGQRDVLNDSTSGFVKAA